jgi:hypothetical protein
MGALVVIGGSNFLGNAYENQWSFIVIADRAAGIRCVD